MDTKSFSELTVAEQNIEIKFYINHASNLIIRCFLNDKNKNEKTVNELSSFISENDKFIPTFLILTITNDTIKGMVSTNILSKGRSGYMLNYNNIRCSQVHAQRFSSIFKKAKTLLLTTVF